MSHWASSEISASMARRRFGSNVLGLVGQKRSRGGDGGQRRAQIVGHGAQKVGAHLFQTGAVVALLLPLELRGHGADEQRRGQQHQKGQRIAGEAEVEGHQRHRKGEIDGEHAQHRRGHAVKIPARQATDERHGKEKEHGRVAVALGVEVAAQRAQPNGQGQGKQRQKRVPPGKLQQLFPRGPFPSPQTRSLLRIAPIITQLRRE